MKELAEVFEESGESRNSLYLGPQNFFPCLSFYVGGVLEELAEINIIEFSS